PRSPRVPYTTLFRSLLPAPLEGQQDVDGPALGALGGGELVELLEDGVRRGPLVRCGEGIGALLAGQLREGEGGRAVVRQGLRRGDRKSTRLNSSHVS